ncbi:PemK-like protein [Candidatus Magnetobacterium bavaricum]|uniref:PemK-like protein n=1 Tax=Candidatus Magnetobacterium bavaricum TaxID=29290 RepID=A0A0F3GSL1_9BACT|nr:PemK-like protein [Candidatus Magnetobacterium bavaricum]
MTLKRGDIVLVPFPFTDLSCQKVRPALVLTPDLKSTDVVIAFISSCTQQKVLSTDYILDLRHTDFPATGLKKTSVFRMNKLLTVQRSLITRRLGKVSPAIQDELDRSAIGL